MLNKFIIVSLVVLLSGCGEYRVYNDGVERAIEVCKVNDGLDHIFVGFTDKIRCVNGAEFKLKQKRGSNEKT